MSRLCAACHKVQSLTQHIHHCEARDLVSTTAAACTVQHELDSVCLPIPVTSGSLYTGNPVALEMGHWGVLLHDWSVVHFLWGSNSRRNTQEGQKAGLMNTVLLLCECALVAFKDTANLLCFKAANYDGRSLDSWKCKRSPTLSSMVYLGVLVQTWHIYRGWLGGVSICHLCL